MINWPRRTRSVDSLRGASANQADDGLRQPGGYALSRRLVTLAETLNPIDADAVHELSAQLIAQQMQLGRRGIAICGATGGVGVTFVAANVAVDLARAGVSTMLIDANMRDPGVQTLIAPFDERPGLQQFLAGDVADRADIIHQDVLPDLSIIYAGGAAPDASELLAGPTFGSLMQDCLRDYDFTIVDTPAANLWADPLVIGEAIGYVSIVARRNVSYIEDIETVARELNQAGATVIGALLNAG